jgi:hypothetical protein
MLFIFIVERRAQQQPGLPRTLKNIVKFQATSNFQKCHGPGCLLKRRVGAPSFHGKRKRGARLKTKKSAPEKRKTLSDDDGTGL